MQKPSEPGNSGQDDWEERRRQVIGLGENSFRKSYYPELQRNVATVRNLLFAIEQSPRGIFVCQRDGLIEYANEMLHALSCNPANSLIGKHPQSLWARVMAGEPAARAIEMMEKGQRWQGDLLIDNSPAEAHWVHLAIHPVADPRNEITHFLGSMENISARKQAEEELKGIAQARTAALKAAEHLAALKSEFIANISHELRTPIFQILGLARLGERSGNLERSQQQSGKIRECGERLMQIVETLLDFSAAEHGQIELQPAVFPLSLLVGELNQKWTRQAGNKGIGFSLSTPAESLPEINTDQRRLHKVLDELLANAVKFTPEGEISLSVSVAENWAEFVVTDTGIGMSPAQARSCLEAFVQSDGSDTRNFGGLGLGLALVAHIVRLLQGTIEVSSLIGLGSIFTVRIPLAGVASEPLPSPA